MPTIEKRFDSVEAIRQWLSTVTLAENEQITLTITTVKEMEGKAAPIRKFSKSALCGLWEDRDDLRDVARYVRELRKPRFNDVT